MFTAIAREPPVKQPNRVIFTLCFGFVLLPGFCPQRKLSQQEMSPIRTGRCLLLGPGFSLVSLHVTFVVARCAEVAGFRFSSMALASDDPQLRFGNRNVMLKPSCGAPLSISYCLGTSLVPAAPVPNRGSKRGRAEAPRSTATGIHRFAIRAVYPFQHAHLLDG